MYEDLYMPLPDPDRYLERTGIRQRKQPDLEWLNEILWAHQTTVPFENIMIYDERQPVSLGIPALYDKIVIRRRGGYCFELNGLLARALSDLGYEVQTCAVKIVRAVTSLSCTKASWSFWMGNCITAMWATAATSLPAPAWSGRMRRRTAAETFSALRSTINTGGSCPGSRQKALPCPRSASACCPWTRWISCF